MGKEDAFQVKIRPSHLQSRGKVLASDTFCLKKLRWIPVKLLVLTTFRQFSASLFSSQWRGSNLDLPFFMMWFSYRYASLIILPTKPSRFSFGDCLFRSTARTQFVPNTQYSVCFTSTFAYSQLLCSRRRLTHRWVWLWLWGMLMILLCVWWWFQVPVFSFYPSSKFFNFWTFVFASLLNFENGRVAKMSGIYLSIE